MITNPLLMQVLDKIEVNEEEGEKKCKDHYLVQKSLICLPCLHNRPARDVGLHNSRGRCSQRPPSHGDSFLQGGRSRPDWGEESETSEIKCNRIHYGLVT